MPAKVFRVFSLAALAVLLMACGGGGGGGPAPPAPPAPPPPVAPGPPAPMAPISAPSYPTLELDAANAPEAVAIALRALQEAPPLATFAVFVVDLQMRTGPSSFGPCAGLPPGTSSVTLFDVDANLAVSAGDVLRTGFVPCTGSTGTITIRPMVVDVAAQRLEARVEFATEPTTGDTIEGSFALVATFAGAPRVQTISDFSVVVKTNGQATYLTAGRVEVGASLAAPRYSFSVAANVASEKLGRSYRLTSTTLLGDRNRVPDQGEIVVEGAPARVRLTPATDPADRDDMANLAIDATGSGPYGAATLVPWARMLAVENLFRWAPNTRPRITRLEITPPNPTRLDTLVPSYDAIDYDGHTVHVAAFWSRNGVQLPIQPTLPTGNFVRGDVIDLTLQAQDSAGGVGRRSITFTIGNAPPTATTTVTPTAPLSIQDLAVGWSGSDPDGDALTATYAWRVDGGVLAEETGASLSHTAHAKDDVVTGVVAVNDGFTTTTAEASVTIRDTPGTVTVQSPPRGVDYDDLISFAAEASDYDGDETSTKDFRLVYGPAGMTVNPDSGLVSWTARGPMFEPTLRVNYGVTIDEPGAGVATGSFVVTDPNHVPPLARGAITQPTYDGLRVADLDSSGDAEILVATDWGIYELEKAPGDGYRQTWATFNSAADGDFVTGIGVEDVDSDGRAEIFASYWSRTIVQYSGVDRSIARRVELPVPPQYVCRDLEVADLDDDGSSEVICLAVDGTSSGLDATGVIVVLTADTLDVVNQLPPSVYLGHIAVANVDDDSALEIVTGSGHVFDGVAALSPGTLPQWHHTSRFGWPIAAGDIDGDGVAEIIGIESPEPYCCPDGAVSAFDARTEAQRWTFATPNPGQVYVADVTGDSTAEILVGHQLIGALTAYNQSGPAATSALFTIELDVNSSLDVIAAGNLDADGDIELIVSGATFFSIAGGNPAPQIEWQFDDPASLTVGGFSGGDRRGSELLFLAGANDGTHRIARFDTGDADISLSGPIADYEDGDAAFVAVDYDDDGDDEALLAAESSDPQETRVLAYDLAGNAVEWSDSTLGERGPGDIAYGDFTGDGHDELVVLTEDGALQVYDVAGGALLYARPADCCGMATEVIVADLDGIGAPEILATIEHHVVVFSRTQTGFAITATSAQFLGMNAMEVTDVDGDGEREVFVLYGTPARLARLDDSLLLRGDAALGRDATDMTTEASSFARKNLVFWTRSFTSEIFAADPTTGAEVWRAPGLRDFVGRDSLRYHDLAGNGDLSISVGVGAGVILTR